MGAAPEDIHLFADRLCLNFANSVDWTADGEPLSPATDALLAPDGLTRWGRRLGVLDATAESPAGELERALALRADLHHVLSAVAADAVGLLGDPRDVAALRRCPGRNCGWLFLDRSGRRRWCSMQICGSREKMRRRRAAQRGRP